MAHVSEANESSNHFWTAHSLSTTTLIVFIVWHAYTSKSVTTKALIVKHYASPK